MARVFARVADQVLANRTLGVPRYVLAQLVNAAQAGEPAVLGTVAQSHLGRQEVRKLLRRHWETCIRRRMMQRAMKRTIGLPLILIHEHYYMLSAVIEPLFVPVATRMQKAAIIFLLTRIA